MNHSYRDITERIHEVPKWWDENAVPRYCEFRHTEVANIYADEVVLARIACQGCHRRFRVAFSRHKLQVLLGQYKSLAEEIESRSLHYGDPPNVDCCSAGPTMNSEMIRVVQYWRRESINWQEVKELEVRFDEDVEQGQAEEMEVER